jgi:hypothetical protein
VPRVGNQNSHFVDAQIIGGTPEVGFELFELTASHAGEELAESVEYVAEKSNILDGNPSFE